MKIWIKYMQNDKMVKNIIHDIGGPFESDKFVDYLNTACSDIDEPTPVVVSKHINHFLQFNTTHFNPDDFVEEVKFDTMIVEAIPEDDKKKKENKFYY